MGSTLMINNDNQLHEVRERSFPEQPFLLRAFAKVISWLFHPVFVPVYVIYFLVYVHPYLFAGFSAQQKFFSVMVAGVVSFTLFPLVTVLLLKGLNFINSIYLRTQKERIIPFIACMIWYFWIWYVWNSFGKTRGGLDMAPPAVQFALATFISTIIGLMVNIRMKVSLHAISMGIVVAFFLLMAFNQDLNFAIYLSIVLLIAGLVCTARFIISDHTAAEVYIGLLTGIISMLVAFKVEGWLSR